MFIDKDFWPRRPLAAILIIFMLTALASNILFPPPKAKAVIAVIAQQIAAIAQMVVDEAYQVLIDAYTEISSAIDEWMKEDGLLQQALQSAWEVTRRTLINQMAESILSWAQNGGDFTFVMDWNKFLGDVVRTTAIDLINNLGLSDLCYPFVLNLGERYYGTAAQDEKLDCPLVDTVMNGFMNDFSQGGWEVWNTMVQTDGNYFGQAMMVEDLLLVKTAEEYDAQKSKLLANQGAKGTDSTPGIVQSYAVQRAALADFDYMLQSQGFSESMNSLISAVADSFISRIAREGLQNMQTSGYALTQPRPYTGIPQAASDTIAIQTSYDYAKRLPEKISLAAEDLQYLLEEEKKVFTILSSIRSGQAQIIEDIALINNGTSSLCVLPSWANLYPGPNPPIQEEYDRVRQEIDLTEKAIPQTDLAISTMNDLIKIMERVIQAEKSNDETALNQALNEYDAIRPQAVSLLQTFFQTQETDLQAIFEASDAYIMSIPKKAQRLQDPDYIGDTDSRKLDGPALYDQLFTTNSRLPQIEAAVERCYPPTLPPATP